MIFRKRCGAPRCLEVLKVVNKRPSYSQKTSLRFVHITTILKEKNKGKNIQMLLKNVTKKKRDSVDLSSPVNILIRDIENALARYSSAKNVKINLNQVRNHDDLIRTFFFTKTRPNIVLKDIRVDYMSSDGCGLSIIPKSLYAIPYSGAENLYNEYTVVKIPKTVPNDVVTVSLLMHHNYFVESELISVSRRKSKTSKRRSNLIVCEKFDSCSGCTFQMLAYDDQLQIKEEIIHRAYTMFYPELLDKFSSNSFGQMIGSPLQYSYRTKLTPHYNLSKSQNVDELAIGFNHINPTKKIVDVNWCPIATRSINEELPNLRNNVLQSLQDRNNDKYKNRGHTLLLRESLRIDNQSGNYESVCLTDNRKVVTQKIGDFVFQFPASEFFQNNSSIMPYVLDYIRYHIQSSSQKFQYLIDAYCGSGFFGISLSKDISSDGKVYGVEISKKSILYAEHNSELNGLGDRAEFLVGNSENIFRHDAFVASEVSGDKTLVIMDPSRKGSNEDFLRQVLEFGPRMIVYVSCNVFTQARDLATFDSLQKKIQGHEYRVEHLAGFDFFPQTKHVETVAILKRV